MQMQDSKNEGGAPNVRKWGKICRPQLERDERALGRGDKPTTANLQPPSCSAVYMT